MATLPRSVALGDTFQPSDWNTMRDYLAVLALDASNNLTLPARMTAKTALLTNNSGDTFDHRVGVFSSNENQYGMMLWNTSTTVGEWATMIYGPNAANRRISFGKVNTAAGVAPTLHAHITEGAFFDLDDWSLNLTGSLKFAGTFGVLPYFLQTSRGPDGSLASVFTNTTGGTLALAGDINGGGNVKVIGGFLVATSTPSATINTIKATIGGDLALTSRLLFDSPNAGSGANEAVFGLNAPLATDQRFFVFYNYKSGCRPMVVDATAGRVGIAGGTGNFAPQVLLDVNGLGTLWNNTAASGVGAALRDGVQVRTNSANAAFANLISGVDADGAVIGGYWFTRSLGQADHHRNVAAILGVQSGTGAVAGAHLDFVVKGTGTPYVYARMGAGFFTAGGQVAHERISAQGPHAASQAYGLSSHNGQAGATFQAIAMRLKTDAGGIYRSALDYINGATTYEAITLFSSGRVGINRITDDGSGSQFQVNGGGHFNGLLRASVGINFNATGGTNLTYYDQGSFTATLQGCTTAPTVTVYYVRVGKLVTLKIGAQTVAESNTVDCHFTGVPAALQPTQGFGAMTWALIRNSGATEIGAMLIGATGSSDAGKIRLKRVPSYADFGATGQKGIWDECCISYALM